MLPVYILAWIVLIALVLATLNWVREQVQAFFAEVRERAKALDLVPVVGQRWVCDGHIADVCRVKNGDVTLVPTAGFRKEVNFTRQQWRGALGKGLIRIAP